MSINLKPIGSFLLSVILLLAAVACFQGISIPNMPATISQVDIGLPPKEPFIVHYIYKISSTIEPVIIFAPTGSEDPITPFTNPPITPTKPPVKSCTPYHTWGSPYDPIGTICGCAIDRDGNEIPMVVIKIGACGVPRP